MPHARALLSAAFLAALSAGLSGAGRGGPSRLRADLPGAAHAGGSLRPSVTRSFQTPWGSRAGELGHRLPDEASAEGPMSFAVDGEGNAFVLDQVNHRVQRFSPGGPPASFPIAADTFADIALDGDGFALLDRLAARTLVRLDRAGRPISEVSLRAPDLPDGGLFTALLREPDGLWAEVANTWTVRLADAEGRADPLALSRPGRRTGDGRGFLRGAIASRTAVQVTFFPAAGGKPHRLARVEVGAGVAQLDAVDSDREGRVFLAVRLEGNGARPEGGEREVVVVLSPSGAELGRVELPASPRPEEQLRRARLGADGCFYALLLSADGASLWRVAP